MNRIDMMPLGAPCLSTMQGGLSYRAVPVLSYSNCEALIT